MTGHRSSRVRKSRICALQMLYQWDIGQQAPELVKQSYWHEVNAQAPREYADLLFFTAVAEKDAAKARAAYDAAMDAQRGDAAA